MQHSADRVNTYHLRRSVVPRDRHGATGARATDVTWDVIIRLHQTGR